MVLTRKQPQSGGQKMQLADRTAKRKHDLTTPTADSRNKRRAEGVSGAHASKLKASGADRMTSHNRSDEQTEDTHGQSLYGQSNERSTIFPGNGSIRDNNGSGNQSVQKTPPSGRHVRFGSENPQKSAVQTANTGSIKAPITLEANNDSNDELVESSDEAPEAVSAATGQQHARTIEVEAAKAAKSQRQARKDARRKMDSRLKAQASSGSGSKRRRSQPSTGTDTQSKANKLAEELLASGELPYFLPDEILNEEPTPVPELEELKLHQSELMRKQVFSDVSKPYKDLKSGSRVIRVLKHTRMSLPPKASNSRNLIREAWLRGTRVSKPDTAPNRKPLRSSFVKR